MNLHNFLLPACGECAGARAGFCAALGRDEVEEICAATELRRFSAGAEIDVSDDSTSPTMIVREGVVSVTYVFRDGRRQILDMMFPGDVLFLDPSNCSESCQIQAATSAAVCEIARTALFDIASRTTEGSDALFNAMLGEGRRRYRQILDLGRKRADERLASFLIDYGRRSQESDLLPSTIRLAVSRGTIADFLCLTKETISRSFTALREDGLLRLVSADVIEIPDAQALYRRARGDDLAGTL